MPTPIICADPRLRQFADSFRGCFSKPQFQYFVTVLLAVLLCLEPATCSALQRAVCFGRSLAGLSRFLAQAPWSAAAVAAAWTARFRRQLTPVVAAACARQQAALPRRPGRPPVTLVTGYLIGDDSVCAKPRAAQPRRRASPAPPQPMAALGHHFSSTAGQVVQGHDVVLTQYLLLGRNCPQQPALYRQKAVCAVENVPFQSKIDLMAAQIRRFAPVPQTRTHLLLDSWYCCKQLWKLARSLGYLITTGVKSNRWLWVPAANGAPGGQWQLLSDYAARLTAADYQPVAWPSQQGGHTVWVHVVRTRVRKLYTCQVILVRESLTSPLREVRYWASSDLTASVTELIRHLATRWSIEVLIGDLKELGLDQYQLLSAAGIERWWTLVLAAYVFLEERRAARQEEGGAAVTIGAARREMQARQRRHLLDWLFVRFQHGDTPEEIEARLAA